MIYNYLTHYFICVIMLNKFIYILNSEYGSGSTDLNKYGSDRIRIHITDLMFENLRKYSQKNRLMFSLPWTYPLQENIDLFDPSLMFAIPRLAIVAGLLIYPNGPLNVDRYE